MSDVRIAQIGCGYWGKNLARNFNEIGVLASIVEDNPETAQAMSSSLGVPAMTLEEVMGDEDIAAVSLATPAETHFSLGLQALHAGKHVYIEKPLALDPHEAEVLIETSERLGRRLMVGHLLQYHPVFMEMKRLIAAGEIGKLGYVYSNRMSLGKLRTEEDVLWSFAPHDVSMILALAGGEPTQVTAQSAIVASRQVADWCTMQMQFANGLRGHVQTSWLHPFKEQRLVAVGSSGMMVFEDSAPEWDDKLRIYRHSVDISGPVPAVTAASPERIPVARSEPLRNECTHFVDCVETGRTPLTDGREGLAVLRVLHRASTAIIEQE